MSWGGARRPGSSIARYASSRHVGRSTARLHMAKAIIQDLSKETRPARWSEHARRKSPQKEITLSRAGFGTTMCGPCIVPLLRQSVVCVPYKRQASDIQHEHQARKMAQLCTTRRKTATQGRAGILPLV